MATYPGGKLGAGTFQRIISQIPPHHLYVEPFVGGGAILRKKRLAAFSIGCDLDPAAIAVLGEWAGSLDADGVPVPRIDLCTACGIELLEAKRFEADTFIYCDPPYLQTAVLSKLRYEHILTPAQHRRLLRAIKNQRCPVMISGYWSRMYADELQSWRTIQFGSMTRGGYKCEEWLWMNYPEPVSLHDYRYVGANYREREKFRRQQRRWSTRLGRMSIIQRQALLSVLEATARPQ